MFLIYVKKSHQFKISLSLEQVAAVINKWNYFAYCILYTKYTEKVHLYGIIVSIFLYLNIMLDSVMIYKWLLAVNAYYCDTIYYLFNLFNATCITGNAIYTSITGDASLITGLNFLV